MSAQDSEEITGDEQDSEHSEEEQNTGDQKQEHSDEDLELSEEGREEVHQMVEAYKDKPTAVMPGTHRTITGTAVNEWLDDEGNPKYGDPTSIPMPKTRTRARATAQTRVPAKNRRSPPTKSADRADRPCSSSACRAGPHMPQADAPVGVVMAKRYSAGSNLGRPIWAPWPGALTGRCCGFGGRRGAAR
jgi:hypothetical protein